MPRTKAFDDLVAVAAARDVFWERGYAATSLAQLQAATGLSKSSLYETYGSKRALFGRTLENYLEVVIAPRLGPLEAGPGGKAALAQYFADLAELFRQAPDRIARRGCLLLNTATDLNDLDQEVAAQVRDYRARVRAAFARAIALDTRSSIEEPDRKAEVLTAAQIGLMVTARVDPAVAAGLADALVAEVSAW